MDEWKVKLKFSTYEISARMWGKSKSDVLKYCKKHYPYGVVMGVENISQSK